LLFNALLAVGLGASACGGGASGGAAGGPPQFPPMPVKVQAMTPTSVDDASEFVATVKSFASAIVKPQVDGNVPIKMTDGSRNKLRVL